jgi:hypothetical protein
LEAWALKEIPNPIFNSSRSIAPHRCVMILQRPHRFRVGRP